MTQEQTKLFNELYLRCEVDTKKINVEECRALLPNYVNGYISDPISRLTENMQIESKLRLLKAKIMFNELSAFHANPKGLVFNESEKMYCDVNLFPTAKNP